MQQYKLSEYCSHSSLSEKTDYIGVLSTRTMQSFILPQKTFKKIQQDLKTGKCSQEAIELIQGKVFVPISENEEVKVEKMILENLSHQEDQPLAFSLVLTMSCNFACHYCYEDENPAHMSDKVLKQAIKTIISEFNHYPHQSGTVIFFGGEPLLRKDSIRQIYIDLRRSVDKNHFPLPKFVLATNGALLTSETLEYFQDMTFDTIGITLDGSQEQHNLRRPHKDSTKNSYHLVWNGLKKALGISKSILLRVNLDKENLSGVTNLLEQISRLPGHEKIILDPNPTENFSGRGSSFENVFTAEEWASVYPTIIKQIYESKKMIISPPLEKRYVHCRGMLRRRVIIDVDGKVYLCDRAFGNEEYSIGDIFNGFSLDLDKSHPFARTPLTDKQCIMCKYVLLCGGGCTWRKINGEECLPIKYESKKILANELSRQFASWER